MGGATLSFDLAPGHPLESDVKGLLRRVRQDVDALWRRVEAHNQLVPPSEAQRQRVYFYFGQYVEDTE